MVGIRVPGGWSRQLGTLTAHHRLPRHEVRTCRDTTVPTAPGPRATPAQPARRAA